MDHLPHPVSGKSQAAHHQPRLHRHSRPATLRTQGRLSTRILRRHSPHSAPSDLRRYLCTPALGRDPGSVRTRQVPWDFTGRWPLITDHCLPIRNPSRRIPRDFTSHWPLTTDHCLPTRNPSSRIPRDFTSHWPLITDHCLPIRNPSPRIPRGFTDHWPLTTDHCLPIRNPSPQIPWDFTGHWSLITDHCLPIRNPSPRIPRGFTDHWPLTTDHCLCLYEPTMNSSCGKPIPHPNLTAVPSPSLLRIQPVVFLS
jgi:hypothetical protein